MKEAWPLPLLDPRPSYRAFQQGITALAQNLICACCACISHHRTESTVVSPTYSALSLLTIHPDAVPYDFSCGIASLDLRHIMIEKTAIIVGLDGGVTIRLCNGCKHQLDRHRLPVEASANRRWVGDVPPELQGLNWLEERLIARSHASGGILRLQRGNHDAYLGIKGHMIVAPQDTRQLLDILPLPRSRLPDFLRVVWTGAPRPTVAELHSRLSVRTQRVYDGLQWLCSHNEDYQNVVVDHSEFERWPPVFVVTELIDSMGHISDNVAEDIARAGAATIENELEDSLVGSETYASGILDVNSVSESFNVGTLERLASLTKESVINVVTGSILKSQYDDIAYFTASFPTIFPYGCGKHLDPKRLKHLSLAKWTSLLLRHCSRYYILTTHGTDLSDVSNPTQVLSFSVSTSAVDSKA